jgi:hypothetical protein
MDSMKMSAGSRMNTPSDERRWKPIRREGLCCRAFDDEAVLYDPAHHAVHYLNRTAWFIWNCCNGHRDVEDITLEVAAGFEPNTQQDHPLAVIRDDVRSTLSRLTENGLIESAP